MLTNKELGKLFPLEVPIGENGIYWNGKPEKWSNMPKYGIFMSQQMAGHMLNYGQFNMDGHNGIDLACVVGTPIVAPCKMWTTWVKSDDRGYGLHVFAESETKEINGEAYKIEMVFGHFDSIVAKPAKWYEKGELIGYADSTGFSTGSHLHFGVRPYYRLSEGNFKQVFMGNGYAGYSDPEDFIKTHIVWDWRELTDPVIIKNSFMKDNEKKLVFEGDGHGRKFIVINGKLREITKERAAEAALYVLNNNGFGQTKSGAFIDSLPKDVDF